MTHSYMTIVHIGLPPLLMNSITDTLHDITITLKIKIQMGHQKHLTRLEKSMMDLHIMEKLVMRKLGAFSSTPLCLI